MLVEYALTPDIFDDSCYSNGVLCRAMLQNLKEPLLQEALVRDLRNGEWSNFIKENKLFNLMAKELLKKLQINNRLIMPPIETEIDKKPHDYVEWCKEALASYGKKSLHGIIVSETIKKEKEFVNNKVLGSIEKLYNSEWWKKRSSSIRVFRTIEDYIDKLTLVLSHANKLMFIDPNIDPEKGNYKDFYQLLIGAKRSDIQPRIEIHRKYEVIRRNGALLDELESKREWEKIFRKKMAEKLANAGLNAEVFLWHEFHDRYLITNIIGINLPYGFDTTTRPKAKTTWCRLGIADIGEVEKEFDPSLNRDKLKHRFFIVY